MANVLIHNISDRPSVDISPKAYTVGGITIRPGKHAWVPEEGLNTKSYKLHGKSLWFGALPPLLDRESKSMRKPKGEAVQMDKAAVRLHLEGLPVETLKQYASATTPELSLKEAATSHIYALRLTGAIFSDSVTLDPETFFWLGRWKKNGSGDFIEI